MDVIREDPRQQRKVNFPESMPAFDTDNPLQAMYIKKRGVERLLSLSRTISSDFARETRKNIQIQSMLTERSIDEYEDVYYTDDEDVDDNRSIAKSALSTEEDNREEASDLSLYDEDDVDTTSIDWSLPGVEDRETDIRFVFDNTDYYDMDLREKRIEAVEAAEVQRADSVDAMTKTASQQLFNLIQIDFSMIFCSSWIP